MALTPTERAKRQARALELERSRKARRIETGIRIAGGGEQRTPIRDKSGKIVGWSDSRGAGRARSVPATDISSSGRKGYGPVRKVTFADILAAHRAGNKKYINKFAPKGSKLFQAYRDWHAKQINADETSGDMKKPVVKPRVSAQGSSRVSAAPAARRVRSQGRPVLPGSNTGGVAGSGMPVVDEGPGKPAFSLAQQFAGLEYDPQIHQLGIERIRQGAAETQHQADIGAWYDQVQQAQQAAAARDQAAAQAGVASTQGATQAILSSLGGGANEGAGMIGAAGLEQIGLQNALGTAQAQLQSDIAPILQAEAARQRVNQRRRDQEAMRDTINRITELTGARGQKKAELAYGIHQDRLQRADQLLSRGDQLRQQRFQNALALQEAKIAAQSMGLNVKQAGIDNWLKKLQGREALAELRGSKIDPSKNPNYYRNFANLDAGKLNELQANFLNSIRRDESGAPVGMPAANPNNWSVPLVNQYLRGLGFKPRGNKRVGRFARSLAEQLTGMAISKKNARRYWGI